MACIHAYFNRTITPQALCDMEEKPMWNDMRSIAHALCPYQKYCGSCKNAYQLTPQTASCVKTKKPRINRLERSIVEEITSVKDEEPKPAKKVTRKSSKKTTSEE